MDKFAFIQFSLQTVLDTVPIPLPSRKNMPKEMHVHKSIGTCIKIFLFREGNPKIDWY